ncbi:Maintenance of ploidy protein mob2 [Paramarasmius palmivorus]|uniref:Maintenance of ploidy protein mob2 n=1 Tax=Paramarasmius palmivorus TaxID=297713 RepID=A0AAW0BPS9_9AGAR
MTRAPRAPKRSPTPTSATFSPADSTPPTPSSPVVASSKPLYLCSPFVEAALVKGNFRTIVMLPKYVDIMEWVAVNNRKSVNLPAPTYIDYVMTWVQNLLDDENVFPTKSGASQFGIVEK